jgi:diaminopimelate decarboxylase
MNTGVEVAQRNFEIDGNELIVGGVRVSRLAADYGTPLFVHDLGIVEQRIGSLREALPDRFSLFYSVKANPSQGLLKFLLDRGCGLEVASGGEFRQAERAGCDPSSIVFAGPGKTPEELRYVIGRGIGEIHAESLVEIDRLSRTATELGKTVGVAVRVNPGGAAQGGAMRMGGRASQFGIDEEGMDAAVRRVLEGPGLRFAGVHLFVGTQILDAGILAGQYVRGMEIAARAASLCGGALDTVDLGGGLGIPYYAGENELDVFEYGRRVRELLHQHESRPEFRDTRFVVEPGRYLVGESGVYVSKVIDIKKSRDKTFVVADGGMHHHLAASGNLGQVIKKNFPVAIVNRVAEECTDQVHVVGPLCTPLDVLGRDVALPTPRVGDLVGVFQSGAYARSASPLGFLSHPTPPEVHVYRGEARLARRAGTYDDYLRDQVAG